jgi:HAD superfamily hydrolase (TIGR01509 family)
MVDTKCGVIFDLDGVISDTQDLHADIESLILGRFGINLSSNEISGRFAGVGDRQMFATLFADYHITERSVDEVVIEKWRLMSDSIARQNIKPVPFALDLIDLLSRHGFVLSIASGSPRHFIAQVMKSFSIEKYFLCSVSSEEVPHGKPHPDIFLEAAKRMLISPANCVVIEDGISGMQGAISAEMKCIGLVKDSQKLYPAHTVLTSLDQVTLELISSLVRNSAPAPLISSNLTCS